MKQTGRKLLAGITALTLMTACLPTAGAAGADTHNSRIAGSSAHSIAINKDNSLYLWGSNQQLQLAQSGETTKVTKPAALESEISFISVAAGPDFSVGLDFVGCVYVWGYGQQAEPLKVDISQVSAIAAGQTNILALKSDGTVWQWAISQQPQQVSGLTDVAAISSGSSHYLALTFTGDVYAWGSNYYGQLGNGTTQDSPVPVKVPGLVDIVDIAAGVSHSLAASYTGKVYAWGNNGYGELGLEPSDPVSSPAEVKKLSNVTQVAAGNESSLALTKNGEVYAWGYGEYGQLGDGSNTTTCSTPSRVKGLSQVVEIAAGVYHNMALTKSTLYTWGRNKDSQLGNNKDSNANTPQRISITISDETSRYSISHFSTLSKWALAEAESLFNTELTPPMLWGNYQDNITRAEFAHLLVGVYEQVNGSSARTDSSQLKKFTDIQDHLLASDLQKAFTLGILSGTSDTTISPDRPITRQEAAKMLCSFIGKLENEKVSTTKQSLSFYSDAAEIGQWAVPYVYYAYQNNIMRGTSNNAFGPNNHLTREQALIIMSRLVTKYGWGA